MIKLVENTKLFRVVKIRVNYRELQKKSMILSTNNKMARRNSKKIKVK